MSHLVESQSFTSLTQSQPADSFKHVDPRRFYSALVLIPILYVGIGYAPPWLFSLFLAATALVGLWEFIGLYFGPTSSLFAKFTSCLTAALVLFGMYQGFSQAFIPWLLAVIALIMGGFVLSPRATKQHLPSWAAYVFGILYFSLLLGHFILLRKLDNGIALIFFVLFVTWLADTGGFMVGLSLGKHPLAPRLSPKKTVEGLIGGILYSVLGAILSHFWFLPFFSVSQCAMLGVALALIGTLGDLGESAIKRSAGIKDSGTIIPGHGGVLDRIDSLLFTGPALYYYVIFSPPSLIAD